MAKAIQETMEKLLSQRKVIDMKIVKLKEEQKAEKQSAILKVIQASGLADLEDADLRKVLESLKAVSPTKPAPSQPYMVCSVPSLTSQKAINDGALKAS